jgi:predicted RNA binding protein YcfA (HicA-like mRNA interferase family)
VRGGPLPILRQGEHIGVLERLGSVLVRRSPGSHMRYVHPDGRRTTVPVHPGTNIGRGLLRKILSDVGISADDLRRLM